MEQSQSAQQANLDLVARVGPLIASGFADSADSDEDLFGHDFVFHFFNPQLPELTGDHHGFDGLSRALRRFDRAPGARASRRR